jgi:hypothetical protein
VTVTDAKHAVALADLGLTVTGAPEIFSYAAAAGSLRDARWTGTGWDFTTVNGADSALPGHTSDDVGAASSAVETGGQPMVFYSDATTGALRFAWRSGPRWRFATLDGPGSTHPGHTGDQVGTVVSAVVVAGEPQVYYHDATAGTMHRAWWNGTRWLFGTIDGPGSTLPGHTADPVGRCVSVTLY